MSCTLLHEFAARDIVRFVLVVALTAACKPTLQLLALKPDRLASCAGTGYLRVDDLRRIVNNLGLALSLRTVKELCLNVAGGSSSSSRARADRVHYRDITDKEI